MWWTQVGSLVIALLGVAAGANWISRRETRRLRELKGLGELHALLPEGSAKRMLARHLETETFRHLVDLERPEVRRWVARTSFVGAVAMSACVVAIMFAVGALVRDDVPAWWLPAQGAFALLAFVGVPVTRLSRRRAERAFDAHKKAHRAAALGESPSES